MVFGRRRDSLHRGTRLPALGPACLLNYRIVLCDGCLKASADRGGKSILPFIAGAAGPRVPAVLARPKTLALFHLALPSEANGLRHRLGIGVIVHRKALRTWRLMEIGRGGLHGSFALYRGAPALTLLGPLDGSMLRLCTGTWMPT